MTKGDSRARLSPMASNKGESYFVDEVSQLSDGAYFVVDMFIMHSGELSARGHRLSPRDEVHSFVAILKYESNVLNCMRSLASIVLPIATSLVLSPYPSFAGHVFN